VGNCKKSKSNVVTDEFGSAVMSRGNVREFVKMVFKPPPPVGAGGGYMFSGRPSVPLSVRACVRPSVRPSVRDSRGSFMFPRYLQYH